LIQIARLQLAGPWVELLVEAAHAGAHAATAVLTHLSCRMWRDHLHALPLPFARALRSHLRPLVRALLTLADAPRSDPPLRAALLQLLQLAGECGGPDARA